MAKRARKRKADRLEKGLGSYATAAGSVLQLPSKGRAKKLATMTAAAGAGLAMAPAADASIVYSGIRNVTLSATGYTTATIGIDLDGASASIDVQLGVFGLSATASYGYPYLTALSVPSLLAIRTATGATTLGVPFVANLSSGAQVGPGTTNFALGSTYATLGYFVGTTGFAGVRFNIAGQPHYSWLRISVTPNGETITVIDWAYEDQANTGINAGAIPEPSSGSLTALGLLALGAHGVRHRRRRLAQLEKRGESPTL
jgi:hypothetical protein